MGLLTRLLDGSYDRRSGLEQTFIDNPADWLIRMLGGGTSATGIQITEQSALSAPAYFRSVAAPSEALASLPLFTYRRLEGGGKEKALSHPLYDLLHLRPNPEQTSMQWREMKQAHLFMWGNAYSEIMRRENGTVQELWPIHPSRVSVDRLKTGARVYTVTLPSGQRTESGASTVMLRADQVLHISGLSVDGSTGLSRLRLHRESIGLTLALQEFGARFFGNGAMSGGWLEHPKTLSDPAKRHLRDSIDGMTGGLTNAHRYAILEEGMRFHETMVQPDKGQFLQSRDHQIGEHARSAGVPGVIVGHDDKTSTYASAEQFFLSYVVHTIRPWAVRWNQKLTVSLLSDREIRAGYFVEHLLDGLLQGDALTRSQSNEVRFRNGNLKINEWRAMENLNPLEAEIGDKCYIMANMIPVDQVGKLIDSPQILPEVAPAKQASESNAERHLLARLLDDTAKRALKREVESIRTLAEKSAARPDDWRRGVDEFYTRHAAYLSELLHVSLDIARAYTSEHRAEILADGLEAVGRWERAGTLRELSAMALGGGGNGNGT